MVFGSNNLQNAIAFVFTTLVGDLNVKIVRGQFKLRKTSLCIYIPSCRSSGTFIQNVVHAIIVAIQLTFCTSASIYGCSGRSIRTRIKWVLNSIVIGIIAFTILSYHIINVSGDCQSTGKSKFTRVTYGLSSTQSWNCFGKGFGSNFRHLFFWKRTLSEQVGNDTCFVIQQFKRNFDTCADGFKGGIVAFWKRTFQGLCSCFRTKQQRINVDIDCFWNRSHS